MAMNLKKDVKTFEIDFAIQKIIPKLVKKIEEYKKRNDKFIKKELAHLLEDREKIYCDDKETIKKYLGEK